ncbi:class I tRNA ligase family protein [Patulibacter defluvii]|uniref:class I tRNA ligase family protein n=1 Tax=Patulibacter defluvii TaxID=3095358 RepID=UPI002A75F860|nr:class I tRNA ligase family protein [Patulibacter sp. DM4]
MGYEITTPIFYVNAAPHLGHAYSTIVADVLARHHRQRGEDVFFLTGTDEHGEPVANVAADRGITPQQLVDENAPKFQAMGGPLEASNDFFIRTSDERHKAAVQEFLTLVKDNGYVYEGDYEGWYCPKCADFKTESEIAEGNTCPIHGIPLTREKERNWFFRLSAFQQQLEQLYADRPDWVVPAVRRNEALAFIKNGLQDVSLSRNAISWGVTVPWDPEHVFYVWWDALLNYYTALRFGRPGQDLTATHWPPVHVIGKDILKFHTIYWPALLMAAGVELPERVLVGGFLLVDGAKMSKSRGNVLDPFEAVETFGADAVRFYLLREVTFGNDGSVSLDGLRARYESELANDFGNLASRSLAMVRRYRDGQVPDVAVDAEIETEFEGLPAEVARLLDEGQISQALDAVWQRVRRLNRYVEERAPWTLAKAEKDGAEPAALDAVLRTLVEGVRSTAVLLHPWLPASTEKLLAAIGCPDLDWSGAALGAGQARSVGELEPLFPKDVGGA